MSDLIRLGGLWTSKDKNGRSYLTGRLFVNAKILIFKNEYRTNENQPTHIMYLAAVEQDQQNRASEPDEFLEEEFEAAAPTRERVPGPASVREAPDEYIEEVPARPVPQPTRRPAPAAAQSHAAPPPSPRANAAPASANRPRSAADGRPAGRNAPARTAPANNDFAEIDDPFQEE